MDFADDPAGLPGELEPEDDLERNGRARASACTSAMSSFACALFARATLSMGSDTSTPTTLRPRSASARA